MQTTQLNELINNNREVEELVAKLRQLTIQKFKPNEVNLINEGLFLAMQYHHHQLRKSGEPFIIHPLNVALILIEWQMDYETVIAGLLHDVIEDTNIDENKISELFNEEILFLIKSVTKISIYSSENRSKNEYGHNNQNYLLQMFINMSQDLRVLFIKIADRYHNMQTIKYLKPSSQERIALETKEIYANLAGRLGMYKIKNQMLDMCMRILEPKAYYEINSYINNQVFKYKNIFNQVLTKIKRELDNKQILYECYDRIKSAYSTYEKLKTSNNVSDLFAIRIIVKNEIDCYVILGIIHSLFVHIKNSFRDFISSPKSNLYQSLHTVVLYKDLQVEIQIRTKEMEQTANYGLASHWKYKEKLNNTINTEVKNLIYNIDQNIINKDLSSIDDRLAIIKKIAKQKYINIYDLNHKKWITVKENINAFEYSVLNNRNKFPYLKQIIVNGKTVSWTSIFDSGDIVEIIYHNKKLVNNSWKLFTNDDEIRYLIDNETQNINLSIENDVNTFIKNINQHCNSNYSKVQIEEFVNKNFNIKDLKSFIQNLKIIRLPKNDLINLFGNDELLKLKVIKKIQNKLWRCVWINSLFCENNEFYVKEIKITKCCSKLPFENVVGVLKDDILEVHKYGCEFINHNQDKIVILNWDKEKIKKTNRLFRAKVILNGYFSLNEFNNTSANILTCIQRYRAFISFFNFQKNKSEKTFICEVELFVKNYSHLYKLMNEMKIKLIINDWKLI